MTQHLLPTTVVGSYPQPDWLIDRAMLATMVPRVRLQELWRVAEPYLAQAQDDATLLAIRDMERAGIDIITDGEMRRESYSNRFATALEGIDKWKTDKIEEALKVALLENMAVKPRKAFGPIRVAATGASISPPLFESLELLGRDRSLQRLTAGRDRAAAAVAPDA